MYSKPFFREKPKTRDLLPANLVKSSLEVGEDDTIWEEYIAIVYVGCIFTWYRSLIGNLIYFFSWEYISAPEALRLKVTHIM